MGVISPQPSPQLSLKILKVLASKIGLELPPWARKTPPAFEPSGSGSPPALRIGVDAQVVEGSDDVGTSKPSCRRLAWSRKTVLAGVDVVGRLSATTRLELVKLGGCQPSSKSNARLRDALEIAGQQAVVPQRLGVKAGEVGQLALVPFSPGRWAGVTASAWSAALHRKRAETSEPTLKMAP